MTTRFTDDFSSATWATNWTTNVVGTSATITVVSGEGKITLPNGSARYVYAIDNYAGTTAQEVLVKVRSDSTTRNNFAVIGVAMSTPFTSSKPSEPTDGVLLRLPGNSAVPAQLVHYHGGTGTDSGQTPTNALTGTTTYWVRLQHIAGIVKYKIWADGGSEPGTWDNTLDITGFTALPAGKVVLGAETTSSTTASEGIFFDSITATDLAAIDGGYTAQAMTASALAVNPTFSFTIDDGFTATPMTASASLVDPTWSPRIERNAVSEDASIFDDAPTTVFNGSTSRVQKDSNGLDYYLFNLTNPLPGTSLSLASVKVKLTGQASSTGTVTPELFRITGAWDEATVTHNTKPAMTLVETQNPITTSSGAVNTIDLTNVYNAGAPEGVAITSSTTGAGYWHTKEAASSTNRPVVEWTFITSAGTEVVATVLSGSALMPDPVVTTTSGVSASGQPMTATAQMVDPTVSVISHIDIDAEPMSAAAEMTGGGFAAPRTVSADPLEATGALVGPVVTTERGPKINVAPMTAVINWKQPAAVNDLPIILNESEDNYFNRVMNLTPSVWWRLNDAGTTVDDRMNRFDGIYSGVQMGQFNGPSGRHSVHFDGGDYIRQAEPPFETTVSTTGTTLEFSLRTSRATQYLMFQQEAETVNVRDWPAREVRMVNGRLSLRSYGFTSFADMTGFRNLADNNWHSVVIRPFAGRDGIGTEIWIDGTFEVRRYNLGGIYGFPDYVGGLPGATPTNEYFVGDMSEIVLYNGAVSHNDIPLNYYAFMGWSPISAEPMTAAVTMPDAKAKGNQKRALYLYWSNEPEVFKDSGGAAEQFGPDDIDFDPMTDFVQHDYPPFDGGVNPLPVGDYHGFKVFARPITQTGFGTSYRDPYTDEPSLINLETDVDLDDYDVIMFKDWPDESAPNNANQIELDFVEGNFPGQKDRLLRQIREANDAGIGLYVTNPRLAVDLGIVDRVEFVPTLHEGKVVPAQGNARGLYDYGSAVKFPWNITLSDGLNGQYAAGTGQAMNTDPAYLFNKAYYYNDTNKNNRFRVHALIENLTDIPSYMIEDAVFHVDYDSYGWNGVSFKYLHREEGLQIGDEYIFNGSMIVNPRFEEKVDYRYSRYFGTFATPMANVKAGTVVTTFGAKHWLEQQEVDNPYRDYATTIVLEPGDNLAGRPVGGKIFVNFTEAPSYGLGVPVQVLPDSEHDVNNSVEWPFLYEPETNAQKDWEFSWTRSSLHSTAESNDSNLITVTKPDGTIQTLETRGIADTLTMTRSSQLFPVIGKPRWEMDGRGMFWLSVKDEVNEGDVTVRATAMTAEASMPQPVVVAQKDVTTNVQSMLGLAQMPKVAEDTSGDVEVHTLPMTAEATITGYGKTISVEPMLAHAEIVENFDIVHATGEQVVLYLHGVDVTLFIKEEA